MPRRTGALAKLMMQVAVHPDVSRLVWRFIRWHHHVDYKPFKAQRLIRKPGIAIPPGVDNYGMTLIARKKQMDDSRR